MSIISCFLVYDKYVSFHRKWDPWIELYPTFSNVGNNIDSVRFKKEQIEIDFANNNFNVDIDSVKRFIDFYRKVDMEYKIQKKDAAAATKNTK
jgi:hypothetical protein